MFKRLGFIGLAAVAALALMAPSALADGTEVTMTLTGVSGGEQGGVYTSPYFATIGSTTNVGIVCDDYNHEVYMGETWTAYEYNFSDLGSARFQGANSGATQQMYDEAAWLITQLAANPSDSGDISFAIWAIFSPNVLTTPGYTDGNAAWWLNQAQNQKFYANEFSSFLIFTPTNSGADSAQEYLVMTPEPGSVLLFCSGILALAFYSRRIKFAHQIHS